jgi:hypothetical protein
MDVLALPHRSVIEFMILRGAPNDKRQVSSLIDHCRSSADESKGHLQLKASNPCQEETLRNGLGERVTLDRKHEMRVTVGS